MPIPKKFSDPDIFAFPLTAVLCSLVIVLFVLPAVPLEGDIYRWQDENGTWHFTDSPTAGARSREGKIFSPGTAPPARHPVSEPGKAAREGMLWKISRNGLKPSYLLGTIHSDDPRVTRLRPEVARALDASDRFVMEMELDSGALMQFGSAMIMDPEKDLETLLGHALFKKVAVAMEHLGMPEMALRRLKPWAVLSMLSMPKSNGGLILDLVLRQRAAKMGKPTSGLETAAEQLAVFDGLSLQDQITLLESTVDQLPRLPALFEQLIKAYAANDLGSITQLGRDAMSKAAGDTASRFMLRLNDERNRRMANRILPYLQRGNSFIAVGSLHLAGPNGLLALLEKEGYETTAAVQ